MKEATEKHTWGKWFECPPEMIHFAFMRVCKVCKTIETTNNPCETTE